MARPQMSKPKISDSYPDQAQSGMSNGRGHFADLPVFPFGQFEPNPAIRNSLSETNGRISRRNDGRAGGNVRMAVGIGENGLWLDHPHPARQGFAALDDNAALQELQFFRRRNPFNLGPILALMGVAGMKQFLVQAGFITQKKEPFGIGIEPANGPNIFREIEFGERAVFRAVTGKLRQHAKRLVKCEDQGPVRALWFPRNCTARF